MTDANQEPQPETDNQRKLRELRAQRAQLVAAREARAAEQAEAEEIAAEERALRDEQALNDAIEKHGPLGTHVAVVETRLGKVILKRASAMKFRRFQDQGDATTEDVAALVRPCVVHPTPGELDNILDELPASLLAMASAVIALAGQRSAEVAKK